MRFDASNGDIILDLCDKFYWTSYYRLICYDAVSKPSLCDKPDTFGLRIIFQNKQKSGRKPRESHQKLCYHETRSITLVRRGFAWEFGKEPPAMNTTLSWYRNFIETGFMNGTKSRGRKLVSMETINEMRTMFEATPKLSVRQAARRYGLYCLPDCKKEISPFSV